MIKNIHNHEKLSVDKHNPNAFNVNQGDNSKIPSTLVPQISSTLVPQINT